MHDWRKWSRARNQLYHVSVLWRKLCAEIPAKHRTDELVQLLEMVELVIKETQDAFETGTILALQLDHYSVVPLPGFEDLDVEMKSPPAWPED